MHINLKLYLVPTVKFSAFNMSYVMPDVCIEALHKFQYRI